MTEAALRASPPFNFPSSEPFSLLVGLCILIVLGRSFLLLEWPVKRASPVSLSAVAVTVAVGWGGVERARAKDRLRPVPPDGSKRGGDK